MTKLKNSNKKIKNKLTSNETKYNNNKKKVGSAIIINENKLPKELFLTIAFMWDTHKLDINKICKIKV